MIDDPFRYVAVASVGSVLSALGLPSTSQGLVAPVVTTFAFRTGDRFSTGFTAGRGNVDE